jgi:hypothetical protein
MGCSQRGEVGGVMGGEGSSAMNGEPGAMGAGILALDIPRGSVHRKLTGHERGPGVDGAGAGVVGVEVGAGDAQQAPEAPPPRERGRGPGECVEHGPARPRLVKTGESEKRIYKWSVDWLIAPRRQF